MIRQRIAAVLIALALVFGFGHSIVPGFHSVGEVEWCEHC
jgi:hypothetical protein